MNDELVAIEFPVVTNNGLTMASAEIKRDIWEDPSLRAEAVWLLMLSGRIAAVRGDGEQK